MAQLIPALISSSLAMSGQCPGPGARSIGMGGPNHGLLANRLALGGPAMAFLMMAASSPRTHALVTNLSMGPTSQFSFALSPFESIMVGLIVLKLMILRYLDVLPIDINKLVDGENPFPFAAGRRKRSTDPKSVMERERLAETMFTVLRRLDMQDCLLRTLCELQVHSLQGNSLPRETKLTLSALSKSGWKRKQNEKPNTNPDVIEERPVLSVFEDAVHIAWDTKNLNGTECQERYFICPLSKQDIFKHFDTIKVVNVL